MVLHKIAVVANLALAATAVLVPPSITADKLGDDNALETLAIDPSTRSVALECPGCGFAVKNGEKFEWKSNTGNTFVLDFQVGSQEHTLEIDGVQLYPPSFTYSTAPFHITQVDPSSEDSLHLRVTGYQFRFSSAETVSEAGIELLPMTFQITSVESENVDPPALTINVLKDSEGRLMIASFQAAQSTEATPVDQKKECNEWPLLCKWKNIVADRIEGVKKMGKGCHGKPHGQDFHNPMKDDTPYGKPPHRFRPGQPHPHHRPHHPGHGGHRHHHGHHRFQTFLRRAFFTILIPILIGIFAGTLTYLVGMALGCLIAITVAKIRGQGYQAIALEEDVEEAEEHGEKEEYAELPAYDEPPEYDEVDVKEVDETK